MIEVEHHQPRHESTTVTVDRVRQSFDGTTVARWLIVRRSLTWREWIKVRLLRRDDPRVIVTFGRPQP